MVKCPVCEESVPFGSEVCPHCKAHIVLPTPPGAVPRPARCLKRSYMVRQIKGCSRENIVGPVGGAALSLGLTTLVIFFFMLRNGGFLIPALLAFGIPGFVFAVLLICEIFYLYKPFSHPVWTKLAAFGKPEEVCKLAEEELNSAVKLGCEHLLTLHFVFARSPGRFKVLPVADLIWVTLRRFHIENDEAPPTNGNDVILVDYRRQKTVLRFDHPDAAQACVALIKEHCPWLIFGSSDKTRRYVNQHADTLRRQMTIRQKHYQDEKTMRKEESYPALKEREESE